MSPDHPMSPIKNRIRGLAANRACARLPTKVTLFVGFLSFLYGSSVFIIPSYTPLIEPDSQSYIQFSPYRPAIYPTFLWLCRAAGLTLAQTTWVQTGLFAVALAYLLAALIRSGFNRPIVALLAVGLGANFLFSSFHRSILSESLYFSLSAIAIACWIEYFKTAHIKPLMGAGLCLGLMIGTRFAGLGLLPVHLLAVVINRAKHRSVWPILAVALLSCLVGVAGERILYIAYHGNASGSQSSDLLFGRAAMVIRPDMTFSGPRARSFEEIANNLLVIFTPLQQAVREAPSIAVAAQLSAIYEALGHYSLSDELKMMSDRERIPVPELKSEFAKQVLLQNIIGYLKTTLLNDFGQWSVAAQKFSPVATSLEAYAASRPSVSAGGKISPDLLHPQASALGVVYPVFLVCGVVTLVAAFGLIIFLVKPELATGRAGFYLLLASYFGAMCHSYTLFISMVNEWTPRFLMAVFLQIEVVGASIVLAAAYFMTTLSRRGRFDPSG